jgi:antitoxin (DNA-binding transcriptional repressor) of toxin-antitoxin stability system
VESIGIRELKQNPQAAVRRVLERGEAAEVTAYGRPTGVVIAPAGPTRRTWVSGAALRGVGTPGLSEAETAAWLADLKEAREQGFGRDPWQDEQ